MKGKPRIIFLDLMRFMALLMMIQGHTIYALIDQKVWFRYDNSFFPIWDRLRGYTAPVFLLVAGTVFVYLLLQEDRGRIKKGLKRALILLFLGYALRFPWEVFVRPLSEMRLMDAVAVDVLHLIGIGLMVLILIYRLTGGRAGRMQAVLLLLGGIIVMLFPVVAQVEWKDHFPKFIAAWFYKDTLSPFPLVPWLTYIFAGGFVGCWLHRAQGKQSHSHGWAILAGAGLAFMGLAIAGDWLETLIYGKSYYYDFSPNLVFHRIGATLLLMGGIYLLSKRVKKIPYVVKIMSKNTLWIYVAHLILLYHIIGAWWTLKLSLGGAVIAVLLMLLLMAGLALFIDKWLSKTRWWKAIN